MATRRYETIEDRIMKIILEPLYKVDLGDRDDIIAVENDLGIDENFELIDSIFYALDYGEKDEQGEITVNHNNVKITIKE